MINKLPVVAIILLLFSCNNNTSTPNEDTSLPVAQINNIPAPQPITFTIDSVYPHDPMAFTQGLQFYKGKLYEGTGNPDEKHKTTLRVVNIKTGASEKEYFIPDSTIFGEGITIFKNKIYQLTWQSHKIFAYNINDIMHPVLTYNWSLDGWGITNDGNNLIISDGSSKLYYVQPNEATKEMRPVKTLTVADNTGELDSLNELEYINGYVFANRWYNNHIYKIDTSNGHAVGVMDLTGLLHQYDPNDQVGSEAVLNGIAYDSTTKKLYITGKDWPRLFQMKLND
ncbi:MAG TPA: glutaminyl-peptide cyclotransferase [Ginsengibacter sp.]|nr:glutaminyl-peptide cyclotransferase [Ginsengibacter sp.]